jgi:hypothetical protein
MVYERMCTLCRVTFVRNVKENISSFFSIHRVSSNTALFAIFYLISKERIVTSVVVNYNITVPACVMSRVGVSLNYASYTER